MRCAPLRVRAPITLGPTFGLTLGFAAALAVCGPAHAQSGAPRTAPPPPPPPAAAPPSPEAAPAPAPAENAPIAGADALDPDACLALVERDPQEAAEAARRWFRFGGGVPAAVCESLALEAMGALGAAALRLDLAAVSAGSAAAALHQAAAGFWLRDDQPEAALNSAEAGLAMEPGAALLLRDKAEALAALGRGAEALAPLDAVLEKAPQDVSALLLRARLRREAGEPEAALTDAETAARLAPEAPDAWLEAGAAQAALGRKPEAREALLKAVDLDRDGPVGEEARLTLQQMELGGD
ncbi:MAG: hypothetical protein CML46_04005 [Rhodobacteraceae bacterium]|nr:hypothetical protein [Paracoccaceae bacterium]MBR26106.1 hypothetical protein [Paracoccaceae bacterium]